ncbi:gluconate:H+ symporter [Megasphaera vaginalis (ex Srinivasan et al. 2021)]|uniref:High-affinity gluconate transporter n=1 Tax=Megasphaera vaginalis (ex Srinivasan et al. 2021) TaxID=1111454 RepID=U7UQH3_9FIRM|nr:gluconate:H+ symporter [Megasphaera vaginalis (ex Srinivasan et al. 2021)]ERT61672.1 high-affinity gluconate transporter [Megasphaera vaginalis (ex Srinivasan et al. 2021)]
MPLVILAIGILILFFLIVKVKLNSFLALLLVAGLVGIAEGLPLTKLIPTIEKGLGGTLGGLAIVVSFGAMLGKLMAESGGAQRIATTLIRVFGRENVKWAVCLTGFIVGIALFYEIGFVLLIPLVFTIAAEAKIPLLEVGIPMAAALSVTHGFLPPHPGPTAISVIYNADIGTTLVYGAILAIPTAIVAGPVYYNFTKDINPAIPQGLYNPKIFSEEEMPGFGISVFTALVPVVLMAASAIAKLVLDQASPLAVTLEFLGQPDMALTISVAIAVYTFGIGRGKAMKEIMETVKDAVLAIAMILLIVGGGGALKQILIDSGVGAYIGNVVAGADLSPLLLAWLVAAVIRTACGSATVAALTAGGIAAPICAATGANPELMVLATGAGSLIFSPPNDPGFWLFKEFFGLTVKETARTWCALETIISLMGLIGVMVLNLFIA